MVQAMHANSRQGGINLSEGVSLSFSKGETGRLNEERRETCSGVSGDSSRSFRAETGHWLPDSDWDGLTADLSYVSEAIYKLFCRSILQILQFVTPKKGSSAPTRKVRTRSGSKGLRAKTREFSTDERLQSFRAGQSLYSLQRIPPKDSPALFSVSILTTILCSVSQSFSWPERC